MTLTLVWLLSTMQVAIADASCGEHAVRWVEAGKTVQRKEKLCIDGTHASSTECSNPKDLKCYFSKFKNTL